MPLLVGFLLAAHGLIHMSYLAPVPAAQPGAWHWPFEIARSWLVTGLGVDANLVRMTAMPLIAITVIGFVAAGLAAAGLVVPDAWFRPLLVVAAIASVGLLAILFDPIIVLGFVIDAVLLWAVLGNGWNPA